MVRNNSRNLHGMLPKVKRLCLVMAALLITQITFSQVSISGKIVDRDGLPIIGATVVIKGTTNGVVANLEGEYSITANAGDVLKISNVGYVPEEVAVSESNTSIDITLLPDLVGLDEIVVVGYGTQRKGDITSAVASVKSEDFLTGNTQNASDLIKGKIAGLTITKSSGDPNESSTINLRGMVSYEGSNEPLVLIDNVPGDMGTVPPENIASIDVLKDASAAAIYGTRGAAGVILITTKSGNRKQKPVVKYSGYITTSTFYKTADFMDASDVRAGKTDFTDLGYDTDWLDEITQAAYTQNHALSIAGGTENATYTAGASYRQEQGIIMSTGTDEIKMNLDVNQYLLDDIVKLNVNLVKGVHKNDGVYNSDEVSDASYAYRQAMIRNPTAPVYDDDGSYNEDFNTLYYYNPVEMLKEKDGSTNKEWSRLTGNITLEPIKGWKTNLMLATHRSFKNKKYYTTSDYYTATTSGYDGYAYRYSYEDQDDYLDLTSRYEKMLGQHRLSALIGYSYQQSNYDYFYATNYDFPTDYTGSDDLGSGGALKEGNAGMGSYAQEYKLIGFFGRVSYGFADKYNILASLRHEGSSKFGSNNKWGNFPSVSLGWTLSNEHFMQDMTWLSNLKLRTGYGVTGVEPEDPYQSLVRYEYGSDYYFDGTEWQSGLSIVSNNNEDLKWETNKEINVGVDFSAFNGRVNVTVDLYKKTTSDMLYWYTVPVPPNKYSEMLANVGEMENKGIEAMVGGIPVKTSNFEWSTSVVLSHNENKLVKLSNDTYETYNYINTAYATDPISLPTHRVEVGKSFGQFWGMKSVGLTDDGYWLIENPETGEAEQFNDEIKSDEDYRQYLGSGLPKVNLGWTNTFKYKKFDLMFQMSGQFGHKILNTQRMFYENNSIAYNKLKSASDKVYGVAPLASDLSQTFVSYYLEDGDYLKMDNITFGYTFNKIKHISSLRLYAAAENLFCITNYSGLDPELETNFLSAGTDDRDKYPSIQSFTFGLNVTF